MRTEQITTTRIVAEEGKVFRHRETGAIYGACVNLGYDYFKAGIPLAEGELQAPEDFEEIAEPEDYREFAIDQGKRLRVLTRILGETRSGINAYGLSDAEAVEHKEYFPEWGEDVKAGDTLKAGFRFRHGGRLYAAREDHTVRPLYDPGDPSASGLYVEVRAQDENNTETGYDNETS